MPIISGGGGGAPDIAAVLAVGDDAAGAGIDNLGATVMAGELTTSPSNAVTYDIHGAEIRHGFNGSGRVTLGPETTVGDGGAVSITGGDATRDISTLGGNLVVAGGTSWGGRNGARVSVYAGDDSTPAAGAVGIRTLNTEGTAGQALVSNGASSVVYGGVRVAAAVPVAAPASVLPFAYDTTAVTGGFYFWNGAAWVKIATII